MTRRPSARRAFALFAAVVLAFTAVDGVTIAKKPKAPVQIQILGLNDFHGQLEAVPARDTSGARIGSLDSSSNCTPPACVEAGGVEYLATHVRNLRAENPKNTVFVSAGDLIGATPLLSAIFHDEPTIEAFNLMGLDYNGVGNHEFDEGVDELLRMAYGNRRQGGDDDDDDDDDRWRGSHRHSHSHDDDDDDDDDDEGRGYRPVRRDGCHPVDGCGDGDPYRGAKFDFLAANVVYKDNGDTIFPPYAIHNFSGGVKVAFVGMTLEGTPLIVSPDGIATVDFLDEAASVNALVPHLKRRGVEAIVVLLHEGGSVTGGLSPSTINSCNSPAGALPPIVEAMDDEIDIVITGHTNWAVNCIIDGKVVTGAASQGRLITDIDAKVDPKTGEFTEILVNNRIVDRLVPKAADLTDLIAEYNVFAGPIAGRVIGSTAAEMRRSPLSPGGDSSLGRLIADAQLAATQDAGAVVAFMNNGGIRADLNAGDVTYGEAFAVQPFSNIVTTKTMTGAQIEMLLEQQFRSSSGAPRSQILHVSEGFTYTWDASRAPGDRVDPASIMIGTQPVSPTAEYRVTMNSFLASGGDDFPAFRLGTNETTGMDDLVALEAYLAANPNYAPVTTPRITRLN